MGGTTRRKRLPIIFLVNVIGKQRFSDQARDQPGFLSHQVDTCFSKGNWSQRLTLTSTWKDGKPGWILGPHCLKMNSRDSQQTRNSGNYGCSNLLPGRTESYL